MNFSFVCLLILNCFTMNFENFMIYYKLILHFNNFLTFLCLPWRLWLKTSWGICLISWRKTQHYPLRLFKHCKWWKMFYENLTSSKDLDAQESMYSEGLLSMECNVLVQVIFIFFLWNHFFLCACSVLLLPCY